MPDVMIVPTDRCTGFMSSGSCLLPRRKSNMGSTSMCTFRPGVHEVRYNATLHCSDLAHSHVSCIFTGISHANKSSSVAIIHIILTLNSSRKMTSGQHSTSSLPKHVSLMHGKLGLTIEIFRYMLHDAGDDVCASTIGRYLKVAGMVCILSASDCVSVQIPLVVTSCRVSMYE
jgi:hypothetical protein